MSKRLGLQAFVISTLLIAVGYAAAFMPGGGAWAPWPMAIGTAGVLTSVMVVGASRDGRIGRLWMAFAVLFAILAGGFCLLLWLPAVDPADPTLWLGLPPRAAIVLYGIGLLPLFVVPVAYAATFERHTLSEADLARVAELARRRHEEEAAREAALAEAGR